MAGKPRQSFKPFLFRSLVTPVIPQGYTLSIAGSFAVAVRRYGFPFGPDVWAFVASAVAPFAALAMIARQGESGSGSGSLVSLPTGFLGLVNIVPVVVVIAATGVVSVTPSPEVGFVLTGLLGAGGYALLVSLYFWLVAQLERRQ